MNENHRRRLEVTFRHIDELLSKAVRVLETTRSESPFDEHVHDSTPVQAGVVREEVVRVRRRMAAALDRLGIAVAHPRIPATWSAQTAFTFADIALEELSAASLRGYGELDPETARVLDEVRTELREAVRRTRAYLAAGAGEDPGRRLERLRSSSGEGRLLRELERVITARGLVEFRPALSLLLESLERPRFEVAVFGRVSSGKSSLLNRILGTEVLPVGVTPITSVPTRIVQGTKARAIIRSARGEETVVDPARIGEFATEQGNPGNEKLVALIEVELPAERLPEGVVLVDTPGLGSLATSGAAQTLAYLPRADFGIVLVDASTALTAQDLWIVDALARGGAKVMVVVSKADLLNTADRERVRGYVASHVHDEAGIQVPIHVVSVTGDEARLADTWIDAELVPMFRRHLELRTASTRGKIGALRDAVMATLRSGLQSGLQSREEAATPRREEALGALRRALKRREECLRTCRDLADGLGSAGPKALSDAASAIASGPRPQGSRVQADPHLASAVVALTSETGRKIASCLEQARAEMARALGSAMALADEGAGFVPELPAPRAMPLFDASRLPQTLILAWPVSGLLGAGMRRSSFLAQLRTLAADPLRDALLQYRRHLADWLRQYLDTLSREFEAAAEACRPWVEGSGFSAGEGGQAEPGAVEQDLQALSDLPV